MGKSIPDMTLAIILLLILVILVQSIAKSRGYFKWEKAEKNTSFSLPIILCAFALFFIGTMALFPLIRDGSTKLLSAAQAMPHIPERVIVNSASSAAILLSILVIFIFLVSSSRSKLSSVLKDYTFQGAQPISTDIWMGAITWVIAFPAIAFVSQIMELLIFALFGQMGQSQSAILMLQATRGFPIAMAFTIFSIVFLAPLIEELLFRGLLQRWLTTKMGRIPSIIASSILFSLVHFGTSQGLGNFILIPSLFVLSIYLGYIYERQRSLVAPFVLHATFNAISVGRILIGG